MTTKGEQYLCAEGKNAQGPIEFSGRGTRPRSEGRTPPPNPDRTEQHKKNAKGANDRRPRGQIPAEGKEEPTNPAGERHQTANEKPLA